jgi:hypothetical protein
MLEHVLVLERSDRVPYIRLPYGDPGFESVSLQQGVTCELFFGSLLTIVRQATSAIAANSSPTPENAEPKRRGPWLCLRRRVARGDWRRKELVISFRETLHNISYR